MEIDKADADAFRTYMDARGGVSAVVKAKVVLKAMIDERCKMAEGRVEDATAVSNALSDYRYIKVGNDSGSPLTATVADTNSWHKRVTSRSMHGVISHGPGLI